MFSEQPAILILIDGDPVYRAVQGTELQRVVNTRPFIVRDMDGIHYLKVFDGWMQAYSLTGLWSVAGVPPPGAPEALQQAVAAKPSICWTGRFRASQTKRRNSRQTPWGSSSFPPCRPT
jgi:hypothetical protein